MALAMMRRPPLSLAEAVHRRRLPSAVLVPVETHGRGTSVFLTRQDQIQKAYHICSPSRSDVFQPDAMARGLTSSSSRPQSDMYHLALRR